MKTWLIPCVVVGVLTTAAITVRSAADVPARFGNVTEARVTSDDGANWLVGGRTFDEQHFSPLKVITDKNVSTLGLAWSLDLYSPMGLSVEPIVVDGVAYVSAPQSKVYAIDAATGKLLWHFDPNVRLSVMRNSWAARTNRGVAVWGGKVFVGTGDCRLVAIDAASGKKLWESTVCDANVTGITAAPHAGDGKVFIGYNGSDTSVRGSVTAFDAETGKELWRFWTVPGDPAKGFESKALEMAAKTWVGDDAWRIGGGDAWDSITYDAVTGLVIFGTAGASSGGTPLTPSSPTGGLHGDLSGIQVQGDKLFSSCVVAVNAKTGEYVWHYQAGRTEVMNVMLADLPINGQKRRVVMTVPKTGIFYTLDARTGELLSQKRIDGQPVSTSTTGGRGGAPAGRGAQPNGGQPRPGHNWWPLSFSPTTGLAYIPANGQLVAWDPVSASPRWSVIQQLETNGGVLSTDGNLVFQGEGTGEFAAYSGDNGRKLWSIKTGSAIQSIPVSYSIKGEQYILMPVGLGSGSRLFARVSVMATPESKRGPSRLLAFKLGGKTPLPAMNVLIPPVPRPPDETASPEVVKKGEGIYNKFMCDDCHSPGADGSGAWSTDGAIPDLRYMPQNVHRQWNQIVLQGSHKAEGMPGFGAAPAGFPLFKTTMSQQEADELHAYIIDLQWKAYKEEQNAKSR